MVLDLMTIIEILLWWFIGSPLTSHKKAVLNFYKKGVDVEKKCWKKKTFAILMASTLFLGTITAYVATLYFFSKSEKSDIKHKDIFEFNLDLNMISAEVAPGESYSLTHRITNDATQEMYMFIEIIMPSFESQPLYTLEAQEAWVLVESGETNYVYAYAGNEMTVLATNESTDVLTDKITMRAISNGDYAAIDDLNISVIGYAIGIENVSANPVQAWKYCKSVRG